MLIIGHRGACGYEPENTLASFKKAIDLHVDMIELDVYNVENQLVLIHPYRLEATTNGVGYVEDMTLKELRRLDAGNGQRIPFLEEALDVIDKRVPVNIELKGANTAALVSETINKYVQEKGWEFDSFMVSSFNHPELKKFKEINTDVRTGAVMLAIPETYGKFAKDLGADFIAISSETISKAYVDDAKKRGLTVLVFTINIDDEFERMKKLGVDGIFTNYPDKARAFFNKAM